MEKLALVHHKRRFGSGSMKTGKILKILRIASDVAVYTSLLMLLTFCDIICTCKSYADSTTSNFMCNFGCIRCMFNVATLRPSFERSIEQYCIWGLHTAKAGGAESEVRSTFSAISTCCEWYELSEVSFRWGEASRWCKKCISCRKGSECPDQQSGVARIRLCNHWMAKGGILFINYVVSDNTFTTWRILTLIFDCHITKTGTSFLMSLFAKHPEITMPEKEFCELPAVPDNLTRFIQETHDKVSLAKSTRQKTGIKCPTIIKDAYQIESLMKLSSDTRLIVGVRHPVLWFER